MNNMKRLQQISTQKGMQMTTLRYRNKAGLSIRHEMSLFCFVLFCLYDCLFLCLLVCVCECVFVFSLSPKIDAPNILAYKYNAECSLHFFAWSSMGFGGVGVRECMEKVAQMDPSIGYELVQTTGEPCS